MQSEPITISPPVSIDDLNTLSVRAGGIIAELRKRMLLPNAVKNPTILTSDKVASLCGMTLKKLNYRITRDTSGLPLGTVALRGGRREFTLEEAQAWTRSERFSCMKPKGAKAVTIGIAFFKGGVTKTTTTMTLAQGLSLLGHRVLNIDMDPQGSLTTLHGLLPDSEIEDEDTLGPLFHGEQTDVR